MLDAAVATPLQGAVELGRHNHHQCYGVQSTRPAVAGTRSGWIVARTHPQAERWAHSNLQLRGYRCYLPMHTILRTDRVVPSLVHRISVPLFTSYLFVWHRADEPRRPIRETPGVRDVLRTGSETGFVRDGAVEALQMALQGGEAESAVPARAEPQWRPGAIVGLARGIFSGHRGVVLSVGAEAALVSILFLGQLREVAISLDYLQAWEEDGA